MEISLDCLSLDNIVLVANQRAAEIVIERIFPHFTEFYLVAADGSYPENPSLRKRIIQELKCSANCAVVSFSSDLLNELQVKSERILVLDDWIANHYSSAKIRAPFRKEINEFDLVLMLICFFDQWRLKHRPENHAYQMQRAPDIDREAMGWRLELIAPPLVESPPEQIVCRENLEKLMFDI